MFHQLKNESDESFLIENTFEFKDLTREVLIFLIELNVSKVNFAMHQRKELVGEFNNLNYVQFTNENLMYVDYRRFISHSMPTPYETQCVDYNKQGYFSKMDCINQCKIKFWKTNFPNQWPANYLNYDTNSNDSLIDIYSNHLEYMQDDIEMGTKCKQQCGVYSECYSEIYELSIHPFYWDIDNFPFPIFPPRLPDLIYTHSASIETVEFLSFVFSIISLYFGFTVIMVPGLFLKVCKNIYNKYKMHFNQSIHINGPVYFTGITNASRRRTTHPIFQSNVQSNAPRRATHSYLY